MHGNPDDPFVYLHREAAHGTHYPRTYGYKMRHGRTLHGYLESVFVGTESQVRRAIEENRMVELPWDSVR
jgi:hypothetical protein